MSRGRKKLNQDLATALVDAAAPIVEKAVIEERNKNKAKEEKKPVTYCKIKFRNLLDKGLPASFTYMGKSYNIPENTVMELKKDVVDHLKNLKVKSVTFESNASGSRLKKVITDSERYVIEVLETYEKTA